MSFHIKRSDGDELIIKGYKYKKPSIQKSYSSSRAHFPRRVDLRSFMTSIESQGSSNSCVANAVAGAYEYLLKRHWGEEGYDVSRLFIYFNGRLEDEYIEDEGARIESVIEGLQRYGACSEATWPFDLDMINEEPSSEAYDEAAHFLIEDVSLVETELDAWKRCLADGYPIIFGLQLYSSFDSHYRRRGWVPEPSKSEMKRADHAGHAMLCVGYSDKDKVFIVRNSWGQDWGDKGYCYVPYTYLMNPKYNFGDSWIIRQLDEIEMDDEYWEDDDGVFDGEGVFSSMDDDAYYAFIDAMGDVSLDLRLTHLMLCVAGFDGEVSAEEEDELKLHVQAMLEELEIDRKAKKLIKKAYKKIDDDELLESSIALFGEYVPKDDLAYLLNCLIDIAAADGICEDEDNILGHIVEQWQIEEASADSDDAPSENEDLVEQIIDMFLGDDGSDDASY